jgi:hypothetical protein
MADAILKVIATGAPYMICCAARGLAYDSFMTWKREDLEFAARVEEASAKAALRLLSKIEKQADVNFASAAWLLERRWPEIFSRPEVQLHLVQQSNVTENRLSITISAEELRQIEAEAAPARERVRKMFEAYRPTLPGNGNGHGQSQRTVDVQAESVKKPEEPAPITSKEDKPEFWFQFASGSGERTVSKEVAIYVAATIVNEAVSPYGRGNQAIVAFRTEPITVADVLSVIEQLCGGPAGWQLMQRKAKLA